MDLNLLILLCAVVLLVCIGSSKLSVRFGVPTLLLFLLLGMLFGSDGLLRIHYDNYMLTQMICSSALIFIMFYGGFGTNWKAARPVAAKAIWMSTLGVVVTAALTALFCWAALGIDPLESALIGAVISSTDAASVFSILRSKSLNLKHGLASLLEVESGSNDPTAYMLTLLVLTLISGQRAGGMLAMVAAQVAFGLGVGFAVALASRWLLSRVSFDMKGLHAIFVVAIALLSYSLSALLGGNGYLSVYVTGIVLGNGRILHKAELVHFFDGVTWLMQILIFFVLGLLSFPSQMPSILLPALGITLFLSFVARPAATFGILSCFRMPVKQQILVAIAGLRGAASIVFAITAVTGGAVIGSDIFHIVFCVSLFSVAFQGTLLPWAARALGLVDRSENVLHTFTDYQEDDDVQLLEVTISPGSPWEGKLVKALALPQDCLIVMIKRRGEILVPKGGTGVQAGDVLVMSGLDLVDLKKIGAGKRDADKTANASH